MAQPAATTCTATRAPTRSPADLATTAPTAAPAATRCAAAGAGDVLFAERDGRNGRAGTGGKRHNTLRGGRGGDRIVGEGGRSTLRGGRGADRIHARDGRRDTIGCDGGRDIVWADAVDRVAPNCQTVHVGRG